MKECPVCHKVGFHKMSCSTQKVTVFIPTPEGDRMYPIPMTAHSAYIPTLTGDEAEDFIRKADEKAMRQRRCKNHVWRKHYLNGGKVCHVCGKAKEEPNRAKDVEP